MNETVNNDIVISVEDLTKVYGREFTLLSKHFGREVTGAQDVSFSVKRGEIFGFLGPNGAGKTTTIRAILGYLNIQTGKIKVFDLDHKKNAIDIRRNMSYVPGDVALYENFTGEELVDYFSQFRPIDQEYYKKLRSIFRADLTLKIKALSKGNRQQVALITSLASKPDLIILDEPSSGLDPLMVAKFHELLKELREEGHTIFLSSHDLSEVQAICDRVGIIKEGKMIIVEEVESLREKAMQNLTVTFKDPSNSPTEEIFGQVPNVVSVEVHQNGFQNNGSTFKVKVREDVNALLALLAKYPVKRMTLEDASLQDIFLEFYT